MQAIASVVSLDRDVTDVYDIVYSACGTARNDEFLLSLKSLQLMALSSPESEHSLYRIHIITGELHMTCSTLYGPYARHYSLQYRFQWLVYPRHLSKLMHAMQTGASRRMTYRSWRRPLVSCLCCTRPALWRRRSSRHAQPSGCTCMSIQILTALMM